MVKTLIETLYPVETSGPRNGLQNYFLAELTRRPGAAATIANQGLERIICTDGTLFLVRNIQYGTVAKLPATKLKNELFVVIRNWYTDVMKTMHDHGVYVHPFWAYRTGVTDPWGFAVQNAQTEDSKDLPVELLQSMNAMSGAVYNHLNKNNTFPKSSELNTLLETYPGDGYRVLRMIVLRCHPGFQESPSTYLQSYP